MKKYLTLLLCSLCALACFSASAESTAGLKDVNVVISTTKGILNWPFTHPRRPSP